MPRKKSESSEAKKSRKGSKDSRINSSPAAEILPPPMPTESHLVASNPFDDVVPSSPMMGGPSPRFPGPMHSGGMVSPPYGPSMGPATWSPGPRGMRPYGSQNWGPMSGEMGQIREMGPIRGDIGHMRPDMGPMRGDMGPMNYGGMPPQQQVSPNGYSMGRGMMPHPGMVPQPGYRPPMRMQRDGMGSPMHSKFPMNRMPMQGMTALGNHGHMPNPVQMKMPPSGSGSSRKTSISDGPTKTRKEPKSRKKSKNAEKAKAQELAEAKIPKTEATKSEPVFNALAPHAANPTTPQSCVSCSHEIKFPTEDCICCLASCNNWYHRKCSGLTKAALSFLQSEELALWACDNCIRTKEINSVRLRDTTIDPKPQNMLIASS